VKRKSYEVPHYAVFLPLMSRYSPHHPVLYSLNLRSPSLLANNKLSPNSMSVRHISHFLKDATDKTQVAECIPGKTLALPTSPMFIHYVRQLLNTAVRETIKFFLFMSKL